MSRIEEEERKKEKLVNEFIQLTACRSDQALYYLYKTRGDLDSAIDYYYMEMDSKAKIEQEKNTVREAREVSQMDIESSNEESMQINSSISNIFQPNERLSDTSLTASNTVSAFDKMAKGKSFSNEGTQDRNELKKQFKQIKSEYNKQATPMIGTYDYQKRKVENPTEIKGPNRLLSYHSHMHQLLFLFYIICFDFF